MKRAPLCGTGSGPSASSAAEDECCPDGDDSAGDGAGHVDPVRPPVHADQGRAEAAGRVHRRAGDGAAPEAGEGDVGADTQRADTPTFCAPEAVPRMTLTRPKVRTTSITKARNEE